MKRTLLALIIAGILAGDVGDARERVYKPHSNVNDPVLITQLRQEMSRLENGFLEIENHYTAGGVDYDKILKALEQMEATGRTIRQVVANKEWNEPLSGLSSQIQKVRKAADRQDPIILRKQIDGLYDACFRCHAANAPR